MVLSPQGFFQSYLQYFYYYFFVNFFPPIFIVLSLWTVVSRMLELLYYSLDLMSLYPIDHQCSFLFYCLRQKFSVTSRRIDSPHPSHLALSGDIFGCHHREMGHARAASEQRPWRLLSISQCTGQPPVTIASPSCQSWQDWKIRDQEKYLTLSFNLLLKFLFQTYFSFPFYDNLLLWKLFLKR